MSSQIIWPSDLAQWRARGNIENEHGNYDRFHPGWCAMRSEFRDQGISLHQPRLVAPGLESGFRQPYNDEAVRAPQCTYGEIGTGEVQQFSANIYPGHLLSDKTMVMVRVVGHKNHKSPEYDIMRYLNSPELRSMETNHTIPLLQEVYFHEWTFLVLPYLGEHVFDEVKPFHTLREMTIFLQQTLEGITFLHEHLIAHRDIADSNIVINIHGSRGRSWRSPPAFTPTYYFIDFELAVKFDPTSDPKSRFVSGLPTERFGRMAAPEAQHTAPYCPFKADVFALGFLYYDYFRQSDKKLPEVVEIFRDMLRTDRSKRSSARRACSAMRLAISNIPPELLQKQMDKPFEPPERKEEIVVALNGFTHDFTQVCDNSEDSTAPTAPTASIGDEFPPVHRTALWRPAMRA